MDVKKDGNNSIPDSIGLAKGDIIVFRGEGDPVRFSAGTAVGKVMMTDPTSETGWVLGDGGGGGETSSATVVLHNSTGGIILAGTVVKINSGVNFTKAVAGDDDALFVVSDEVSDEEDVECYSIRNTVCLVRCDTEAVAIGDSLTISSTNGILTKRTDTTDREVAVALTAKASGNGGTVKALLSNVNPYAVLAIKDGGTGATTASGAWDNIGGGDLGKKDALEASDIPEISTDKLTSGTLPIDRGGTGATSESGARTNLGLELIVFGIWEHDVDQNIRDYWMAKIPADDRPRFVKINSSYGAWYGYMNCYENNNHQPRYGSGVLTRYDGKMKAVFLNDGSVSIKNIYS